MPGGSDISTPLRKQAMLKAMQATFGVVKLAADQAGIDRTTHYVWMKEDADYAAAVHDLKEVKKDFIESKLLNLVQTGDTAATIFAAKTLLKDRGYVERQEIEHSGHITPLMNIDPLADVPTNNSTSEDSSTAKAD